MKQQEYIFGFHAVNALLRAEPELITELYLLSGRNDQRCRDLIALAQEKNIPIHKSSRVALKELLGLDAVHQGIIAKCRHFTGLNDHVLHDLVEQGKTEGELLLLVLDGVQDPHNLGACLRSANAFGVDAVIAPSDRACGLTSVVRKVACGGAELTPFIQVKNLSRTLTWLQQQGVWIVGLMDEAEAALHEIDLTGSIALVLGSEGQGMRKLTRKHCDYLAKIPLAGDVESINVSAASAVSLYEAQRQRLFVDQSG